MAGEAGTILRSWQAANSAALLAVRLMRMETPLAFPLHRPKRVPRLLQWTVGKMASIILSSRKKCAVNHRRDRTAFRQQGARYVTVPGEHPRLSGDAMGGGLSGALCIGAQWQRSIGPARHSPVVLCGGITHQKSKNGLGDTGGTDRDA